MSNEMVEVENLTAHDVPLRDGVTGDECIVRAFERISVEKRFLERAHNLYVHNEKTKKIPPKPEPKKEPETPPLDSGSKSQGLDLTLKAKSGPQNSK